MKAPLLPALAFFVVGTPYQVHHAHAASAYSDASLLAQETFTFPGITDIDDSHVAERGTGYEGPFGTPYNMYGRPAYADVEIDEDVGVSRISRRGSLRMPVQGPPGSSLITLVEALRKASPALRKALLRHFCHSVARLKTLPSGVAQPHERAFLLERRVTEGDVSTLVTKLNGVFGAITSGGFTNSAVADTLLVPFARLVVETEGMLFSIAREGDAAKMESALSQLSLPLVRGLSHMEAPHSGSTLVALEPLKASLTKRAKELDAELLDAQAHPERVILEYSAELDNSLLKTERKMDLPEGDSHMADVSPLSGAQQAKYRKLKRIKFLSMLFVVIIIAELTYIGLAKFNSMTKTEPPQEQDESSDSSFFEDDIEDLEDGSIDNLSNVQGSARPFHSEHENWMRRDRGPLGNRSHVYLYPSYRGGRLFTDLTPPRVHIGTSMSPNASAYNLLSQNPPPGPPIAAFGAPPTRFNRNERMFH
ncbi:hypothetical protein cyc_08573 [Cyclospora cayetanensis]|uniref:Transmembrane protein n=1 Tax=Cyclospora cayetanensis TaxID=88456 RepID=A0A1D3D317_9EIME|nr:hypothetical protein cyc_08573 [Cyclospora cayetanensis]